MDEKRDGTTKGLSSKEVYKSLFLIEKHTKSAINALIQGQTRDYHDEIYCLVQLTNGLTSHETQSIDSDSIHSIIKKTVTDHYLLDDSTPGETKKRSPRQGSSPRDSLPQQMADLIKEDEAKEPSLFTDLPQEQSSPESPSFFRLRFNTRKKMHSSPSILSLTEMIETIMTDIDRRNNSKSIDLKSMDL